MQYDVYSPKSFVSSHKTFALAVSKARRKATLSGKAYRVKEVKTGYATGPVVATIRATHKR